MSKEPIGIRGSALTGISATAIIVLDGGWGAVPGGQVFSGHAEVFYLAVCRDCGNMVVPFATAAERNTWADQHPHDVAAGLELRDRRPYRRKERAMRDGDFVELIGDKIPYHLREDSPPLAECDRCGRKTWAESEIDRVDQMRQPDGLPCGGWFARLT